MGPFNWELCYWCEVVVYNAPIVVWIGEPLCEQCLYKMMKDREAWRPNAICHKANVLRIAMAPLPAHIDGPIIRHIASFLEDAYRPGFGSRCSGPPRPSPPRRQGPGSRIIL